MNRFVCSILVILLSSLSASAFVAQGLLLKLRMDVSTGEVKGEAEITGTPEGAEEYLVFFLGQEFSVTGIKAAGSTVDWGRATDVAPPTASRGSSSYEVKFRSKRKQKNTVVKISYEGRLSGLVNSSDRISENMVELTRASGYYPHTRIPYEAYRIEIQADSRFRWISNGSLARSKPMGASGLTETIFQGSVPSKNDIVLIAAPDFRVTGGASEGMVMAIYHTAQDTLPQTMVSETMFLSDYFRDHFGQPPRKNAVTWVRSPRVGRSYVRPPLFVSAAEGATGNRRHNETVSHISELLGHVWWGDSPETPYLSAGLSQYAAWKAVGAMLGDSVAVQLRREARKQLSAMIPEDEATVRGLKLAWALNMLEADRNVQELITPLAPYAQEDNLNLSILESALSKGKPLPDWWNAIVKQNQLPDFALRAHMELDRKGGSVVKGKLYQVGEGNYHFPLDLEMRNEYESKIVPLKITGRETGIEFTLDFVPTELLLDPKEKILRYEP